MDCVFQPGGTGYVPCPGRPACYLQPVAQSGLPPIKLGDLLADADLMRLARQRAREIFEADPLLSRPEHAGAGQLLAQSRQLTFAQVS